MRLARVRLLHKRAREGANRRPCTRGPQRSGARKHATAKPVCQRRLCNVFALGFTAAFESMHKDSAGWGQCFVHRIIYSVRVLNIINTYIKISR